MFFKGRGNNSENEKISIELYQIIREFQAYLFFIELSSTRKNTKKTVKKKKTKSFI